MACVKQCWRCWAEIDLEALRANLAWLRHWTGPGIKLMAVVKADAYGHGLRPIAGLLMQSGADVFGVANLTEAQTVRRVGEGWPVLMLGPLLPEEVEWAVRDQVMPSISSVEEAQRLSRAGLRQGKTVEVHVKVDTGMGRLGAPPRQAIQLLREVSTLPGLRLAGLWTHFSSAEDDPEFTRRQRNALERVLTRAREAGLALPWVHTHNSAALLHEPLGRSNLVRPGLLIYGIVPPGTLPPHPAGIQAKLRPALSFKCRVGLVKQVRPGTPVSYGQTFRAPREMRIATLTAGYGDGFRRAAGNRAEVLVRGQRCPVRGVVTMDQCMVEVTRLPEVHPGDEAVLIGKQGTEEITAVELARVCHTIPWEIVTGITGRVPRVYLGGAAA